VFEKWQVVRVLFVPLSRIMKYPLRKPFPPRPTPAFAPAPPPPILIPLSGVSEALPPPPPSDIVVDMLLELSSRRQNTLFIQFERHLSMATLSFDIPKHLIVVYPFAEADP